MGLWWRISNNRFASTTIQQGMLSWVCIIFIIECRLMLQTNSEARTKFEDWKATKTLENVLSYFFPMFFNWNNQQYTKEIFSFFLCVIAIEITSGDAQLTKYFQEVLCTKKSSCVLWLLEFPLLTLLIIVAICFDSREQKSDLNCAIMIYARHYCVERKKSILSEK